MIIPGRDTALACLTFSSGTRIIPTWLHRTPSSTQRLRADIMHGIASRSFHLLLHRISGLYTGFIRDNLRHGQSVPRRDLEFTTQDREQHASGLQ